MTSPSPHASTYFDVLAPEFTAIRASCDDLLRVNQEAMRQKASAASSIARSWSFVTLVLALGLMGVGIIVELGLSRAILGPVQELTNATVRVAGGELDTVVPVRSNDEIGTLAQGFNRMAASIRDLRQADMGRLSRMKAEFVDTASRELRAPLTNVQMGIHLLIEGGAGALADKQIEILSSCREDAAQLDRRVRELLELSTAGSGNEAPVRSLLKTSGMIRDAAEALRYQAEARGIQVTVDAPPDLPMVFVDREQIARVIESLITNAIRATPADGRITVSAASHDGIVEISVADTGAGIPREVLPHIFEPFARIPGAPEGGPGLGLAISRQIIEHHGGQLSVQSAAGKGSTFTFTIPTNQITV